MSLLPKSVNLFKDDTYWNQFFEKRGSRAFEWYGDYPELCGILHKYVKTSDTILSVGCGNSTLSENLYDLGHIKNVNIDISNTVIKQMKDKNGDKRPNLEFHQMDVTKMSFEDGQFSVVIDKGTLDALMPDKTLETLQTVELMLSEINRVLRFGGRYICISLLQKQILNHLIETAFNWGWMVRVHRCVEAEKNESSKQFSFPVFVVICTKMKTGMKPILEFVQNESSAPERLQTKNDLQESVKSLQQYSLLCHQLSSKKMLEDVSLDLFINTSLQPRYTVFVVDGKKADLKYGVFIVPQGRENEWLFATSEGRQQLTESAKCERLLVVHLNRSHTFTSLDEVKIEISERALDFAPTKLQSSQVPIMSLGDSIGVRNIIFQGSSSTTGDYFIEDVELNKGQTYRRLIFASNQHLVQSETKMKPIKNRKSKTTKLEVDRSYLACQHHISMIAGLALLPLETDKNLDILIVGLGAGSLPSFVQSNIKNSILDVVDIDETIAKIAKDWFNFKPNERMRIHIKDGIKFINETEEKGGKYSAILLDVDNKDVSEGLSVPPPCFLEVEFLKCAKKCLTNPGILILNLACRSENLKEEIYKKLRGVFGTFWIKKVPEEINQILYCICDEDSTSLLPPYYKNNLAMLNKLIKQQVHYDVFDIEDASKLSIGL